MKHWIIKWDSRYCGWRELEDYYCEEKEDIFTRRLCTNKGNAKDFCNEKTCPIRV